MKYKGIELNEFTSDKPVVFDPPKRMLVWDNHSSIPERMDTVYAYLPKRYSPVQCTGCGWGHCAEIPEEPKPRKATNRELAKWLAKGNGERRYNGDNDAIFSFNEFSYNLRDADLPVDDWLVRKWDDEEWHEPTTDYMGLEG